MTKTYELIAESLNEIITDLEKNDGKNLKHESLSITPKYKSIKQNYHLNINSSNDSDQSDINTIMKTL